MHPVFEQRLGRVRDGMLRAAEAIRGQRAGLEAWVAFGALLRSLLAQRGVDPTGLRALRLADQAAAELARLPDPPAAEEAEAGAQTEADREGYELLLRRLARLAAANFADGRRPDPERSPPAEWLAWCLFTPAAGDAEPGDRPLVDTSSPSIGRPGRDVSERVEHAPIGSNERVDQSIATKAEPRG